MANMANAETHTRRFKLLRPFRLRTLFLLVSILALLCGWEADRLQRRARAVALLEQWDLNVNEGAGNVDGLLWRLLPEWTSDWLYEGRRAYESVTLARGSALIRFFSSRPTWSGHLRARKTRIAPCRRAPSGRTYRGGDRDAEGTADPPSFCSIWMTMTCGLCLLSRI